jgi:hypothetical protein
MSWPWSLILFFCAHSEFSLDSKGSGDISRNCPGTPFIEKVGGRINSCCLAQSRGAIARFAGESWWEAANWERASREGDADGQNLPREGKGTSFVAEKLVQLAFGIDRLGRWGESAAIHRMEMFTSVAGASKLHLFSNDSVSSLASSRAVEKRQRFVLRAARQ